MLLAFLRLASLATLLPVPSDTPPAQRLPAPAPRELRAVDDVVLTARMADGTPAPSTILLPVLLNRTEVFAYMRSNYPASSLAEVPAVMPVAWVYVDESGSTHLPELIVGSGEAGFDALALEMVKRARFAPALVDSVIVPVWVMLPVQLGRTAAMPPASLDPTDRDKPRYLPYTKKPQLINREMVGRALVRSYPPTLRDSGTGGTTLVWVMVDEAGNVARVRVRQTSGLPQLDAAAESVAWVMKFTPAENRGVKVPVWISLPIVYRRQR